MPIQTTYPINLGQTAQQPQVIAPKVDTASRAALARLLQQPNTGPARHPLEAASRVAMTAAQLYRADRQDEADAASALSEAKAFADILSPVGPDAFAAPGMGPDIGQGGVDNAALAQALAGSDTLRQSAGHMALKRQFPDVEPETFGQPVASVDAAGEPSFFRVGNRGAVQPVSGYRPPPEEPKGGTTQSQAANNLEILDARAQMEGLRGHLALQLGHMPSDAELGQEIIQRSTRVDPLTGMPQVDYNSNMMLLARRAAQRRVGTQDSQAGRYVSALGALEGLPAETRDASTAAAAPTPDSEGEGEGIMARVLQMLGYGGTPAAGAVDPGAAPAAPAAPGAPAAPAAPAAPTARANPRLKRGAAPRAAPTPGQGTVESPFQPQSQADYDAIPSGAIFINPADGKPKRKP